VKAELTVAVDSPAGGLPVVDLPAGGLPVVDLPAVAAKLVEERLMIG
jgi:hypothetical protein